MATIPTSVEPSTPASADLLQKFRQLRRSFLFWKAVGTISSTIVGLMLTASCVVIIDYFWPIAWQGRLLIVAIVSAVVLSIIYRLFWLVLSPPRYSELARSLRTDKIDSQSNLVASGMLLEDAERRREEERRTEQALDYAARSLDGWEWHRSVHRAGPLSWLGLCVLIALGLSLLNVAPHINSMGYRWLHVVQANVDADYLLKFIDPPETAYTGQSLYIDVQSLAPLNGNVVNLTIDGNYDAVKNIPTSGTDRFRFQVENIQSTITVTAVASSTVFSRPVTISIQKPITVDSHQFEIDPPDYIGQRKYQSDKKDVIVTQNSKITLALEVSDAPSAVQLQTIVQGAALLLRGTVEQPRRVVFDLSELTQQSKLALGERGEQQLVYRFLTDAAGNNGETYSLNYPLTVSVKSDAIPQFENVKIVTSEPSDAPDRSPVIQGVVRDDFGLTNVSIELQGIATLSNRVDETLQELKSLFERKVESLTQLNVDERIDLERLMQLWPTCDAIDVSLIAVDSAGQKAKSVPVRIAVYEKGQSQGQIIQEIRSVLERQQQLQQQTAQASQLSRLPDQLLRRLKQDQLTILEEFGSSFRDEGDDKLQQTIKSIENLMRASAESIELAQLAESESLQKTVVEKLRDLARQSQSLTRNQDTTASESIDLKDELEKWTQRQDEAVERLSTALKDQDSNLASIAGSEQELQQEIAEYLNQMDQSSALNWPLKQVTTLLSRTHAKLQRNRRDSSSLTDAQFAADILRSLSNLATLDERGNSSSDNADEESNQENAMSLPALEELQVIRDLQISLKGRLENLEVESNSTEIQMNVRELASQQRLLFERMRELVKQVKE